MQKIIGLVTAFFAISIYALDLPKMSVFEAKKYHYTIEYPAKWKVYDRNNGVVVFKTYPTKFSYPVTVNIQTIYTKAAEGSYATVAELMDDFTKQAPKHAQNVRFLKREPIIITEADGAKIAGEQTWMTFQDQGQLIKQWQIMVMAKDGKLFQAWAYRAADKQYEENLKIAKKMLDSWVVK